MRVFAYMVFFVGLLWPMGRPAAEELMIRWDADSFPAAGAKGFVELKNGDLLASRHTRWEKGVGVLCSRSTDGGATWCDAGIIANDPDQGTYLGDGHLIQRRNGEVLYCYRHNRYPGDTASFSIRVCVSRDGGGHWEPHSTVEAVAAHPSGGPRRGLWSSFLLEKKDGTLQCYYDDENAPCLAGFPNHQWLQMKTWDAAASQWGDPVTVSRAHDPRHLSRDGMASVVELEAGHLLCALESCQVSLPHANVIRLVTSDDGGKTWSWRTAERRLLYAPAKPNFMAVAPWMIRLHDGALACVFATDEDRDVPDKAGTPPPEMHMDIKCALSADGGQTWSREATTVDGASHRTYMPGIAELSRKPYAGTLLVLYLDTQQGCFRGKRGRIMIPAR